MKYLFIVCLYIMQISYIHGNNEDLKKALIAILKFEKEQRVLLNELPIYHEDDMVFEQANNVFSISRRFKKENVNIMFQLEELSVQIQEPIEISTCFNKDVLRNFVQLFYNNLTETKKDIFIVLDDADWTFKMKEKGFFGQRQKVEIPAESSSNVDPFDDSQYQQASSNFTRSSESTVDFGRNSVLSDSSLYKNSF